eukprot:TRINITY_DN31884_c0_g1_i1.p1 TRINITY_DN31884_c0_g1~~TRINITY_DN31884_c0_g1_i1.p1  ORF type:complete len:171 (+),score=48.00 TRINITY_DN31884_c0_g1_i1:237-749(+)
MEGPPAAVAPGVSERDDEIEAAPADQGEGDEQADDEDEVDEPADELENRLHRDLQRFLTANAAAGAFMAGVLEFLIKGVVDTAGRHCKELQGGRITPGHLLLAFQGQADLHELLSMVGVPKDLFSTEGKDDDDTEDEEDEEDDGNDEDAENKNDDEAADALANAVGGLSV